MDRKNRRKNFEAEGKLELLGTNAAQPVVVVTRKRLGKQYQFSYRIPEGSMSLALNFQNFSASNEAWDRAKQKKYAHLDVSIDSAGETCLIALKAGSSFSFSRSMLGELVGCASEACFTTESTVKNRVLLSKRPGVFSLGGDLAFFKECITRADAASLTGYALTAVDAVWESVSGSGRDDMLSIALVQGEAQGGGFEAALASHVLIAERGSWFGFPEGLFGLFPGMGAKSLLTARGSVEKASRIIGSARRYSAEELYSEGVVDFLAEAGCGMHMLNHVCGEIKRERLLKLRHRFEGVEKDELITTVLEWTDLAMSLSEKHLRTIEYLIQAQARDRRATPTIRVV